MQLRLTPALASCLTAIAVVAGCGRGTSAPAHVDATAEAETSPEPPALPSVDSAIDATLVFEAFHIDEIRKEFPIKAGMTIADVVAIAKQQDSLASEKNLEETCNLGWEKRNIRNGNGWMYFWVNGKHLLHCDLVIENGRVKGVWVMPGNKEWSALVYFRLSGTGRHEIEGRTAADPSRIEANDQLGGIESPADVDHLWLHSARVTNDGMKRLPAFTNLRKLDFNYPGITEDGLQHLQTLKQLRELHLGTVALTDRGLVHIKGLESLEELTFWHNKEITDEGLRNLKNLVNLKVLRLDGTSITDQGLVHLVSLPSLQELSLADCMGIGDDAVGTLAQLTKLKVLNLLNSGIKATAADELKAKLKNCKVIAP